MKSRFSNLPEIKPDPLFETFKKFKEEKNPNKMNLSLGMLQNEEGNYIEFQSVKKAEKLIQEENMNKEYPTIIGVPQYLETVKNLFFPKDNIAQQEERILITQPVTGGASLRMVCEIIKRFLPKKIHMTKLLFGPYLQLFDGVEICYYPYYCEKKKAIDFEKMLEYFESIDDKSIVLFQLSSHNPTALDLENNQWDVLCELFKRKKFLTVFDSAYLGYASGSIEGDLYPVRKFTENFLEIFVCYSSAKNFTNYSDDIGGLMIVLNKKDLLVKLKSHMIVLARSLFSFPSLYGARVICKVVNDPEIKALWLEEQRNVYDRIINNRKMLINEMKENGIKFDYEFLERQRGIYMFLDIPNEMINTLVNEHLIFLSERGRINLSGINKKNVKNFVEALKKVLSD